MTVHRMNPTTMTSLVRFRFRAMALSLRRLPTVSARPASFSFLHPPQPHALSPMHQGTAFWHRLRTTPHRASFSTSPSVPSSAQEFDHADLQRKADAGDSEAMYELAQMYLGEENCTDEDANKAASLLASASSQWHTPSMHLLGEILLSQPKNDEQHAGFCYVAGAAARNHSSSYVLLAHLALEGKFMDKSAEDSLFYLRRAADLKDGFAMCMLGQMYVQGAGTIKADHGEGMKWLEASVKQGYHPAAAMMLEVALYRIGENEKERAEKRNDEEWQRKVEKVEHLSRESGINGSVAAAAIFMQLEQYEKAMAYYKDAIERGLRLEQEGEEDEDLQRGLGTAMCSVGVIYKMQAQNHSDMADAVEWFRKAAERGDTGAMEQLAEAYKKGLGVNADEVEATRWLKKSVGDDMDRLRSASMGKIRQRAGKRKKRRS